MASIRTRTRADGTASHQVIFRRTGRSSPQEFATFDDYAAAKHFQGLVDRVGADTALEILDVQEGRAEVITLRDWCLEHVDMLTGVTEGTRSRYRSLARGSLGHLADMPVQSIGPKAVAAWINAIEASGAAAKTVANKHGFLYSALEGAIAAGHIATNPCKGTRLPRSERREMVFLTHSEFVVLMAYIRPDTRDFVTALVGTGHRFGEETALQVRDWDPNNRRISISRSWKYSGNSSRPVLGPPKTSRSRRSHTVSREIADIYTRAATDKSPNEFLFLNSKGDPWKAASFHSSIWQPAVTCANGHDWEEKRARWEVRRAGIVGGPRKPWRTPATSPLGKVPRIHDLRHTYASWMLQAGKPIIAVSRRLGHESIKTTVDTYGHLSPADDAALDEAMSIALSLSFPQIEP